jgi:hypothetical protein
MKKVMMSDIHHQFHCERSETAGKSLDKYNLGYYVSLNFTLYDRIGGSNR